MTDIRNGINAGKTVTVHDTQITLNGWSGTGYTILDPNTGAGAYMIGGGVDGGATIIKDSRDMGFSFTALMPNFEFIDNESEVLIRHMATAAHIVKLSIIQINKFFRCNKQLVINFAVAIGIAVIIALLVGTEAISLGAATPVVAPAIVALIAILPASASAKTLNANSNCKSQCLFANESNIRAVLALTTELTLQRSVSLPAIQRYVERFENGEKTIPPIKVDGNIIVDGNHRFITGKLCKSNVSKIPGIIAPSQIPRAYPIKNIEIDILDWGNI